MSTTWSLSLPSSKRPKLARHLTYRPSINLQGFTCCACCRLRPGVIFICILIIPMTATQFLYLHVNDNEWWLWTYFAISILFSLIAIIGACKYMPIITRVYSIWLGISVLLTVVDEYLFGNHHDRIFWLIVISVMILLRIYFIWVLWKFSDIVSVPYELLHEISAGL